MSPELLHLSTCNPERSNKSLFLHKNDFGFGESRYVMFSYVKVKNKINWRNQDQDTPLITDGVYGLFTSNGSQSFTLQGKTQSTIPILCLVSVLVYTSKNNFVIFKGFDLRLHL